MKKLGKKNISTQESIEAYATCTGCSACGGGCQYSWEYAAKQSANSSGGSYSHY
jgi:putative bacteriocin precursor